MEKMIQNYEKAYKDIEHQIDKLNQHLDENKEKMQTIEREHLKSRIDTLKTESFELLQTINELEQHR